MADEYQCLHLEKRGGIATITIAHPPINLFDVALMGELDRAGRDVETDPGFVEPKLNRYRKRCLVRRSAVGVVDHGSPWRRRMDCNGFDTRSNLRRAGGTRLGRRFIGSGRQALAVWC